MVSRFVRWEAWIVDCSFSLNSSLQYLITSEVLPTRPAHANRADGQPQLARPAPARGRGSGGALGAGVWGAPGAGAWARAPSPSKTILRDSLSIRPRALDSQSSSELSIQLAHSSACESAPGQHTGGGPLVVCATSSNANQHAPDSLLVAVLRPQEAQLSLSPVVTPAPAQSGSRWRAASV